MPGLLNGEISSTSQRLIPVRNGHRVLNVIEQLSELVPSGHTNIYIQPHPDERASVNVVTTLRPNAPVGGPEAAPIPPQ